MNRFILKHFHNLNTIKSSGRCINDATNVGHRHSSLTYCIISNKVKKKAFGRSHRLFSSIVTDSGNRNEIMQKYYAAKEACEVGLLPPDVDPYGIFVNSRLNLSQTQVQGFDYDYTLAAYKESLRGLIFNLKKFLDLPPPDVDPYGIFANNELNLSKIQVYGFDYDYTLAVYKESLHYLIYDLGKDWLISKFKYPAEIQSLEYHPGFAIRGLHYDIQKGLLMKIDSFHQIQYGSVYRGLTPLSMQEVRGIYGGSYIPQNLIRGSPGEGASMQQLNDLFSVPEICLLSNVTEYFHRHNIAYHPEILFYDVQTAVRSIHPVMHRLLSEKDCIDQYLEKQPNLITFLERLQSAGKKMFLITNSPFKFVDKGMSYMIGPDWAKFFDLVVAQARKPKFFTDQTRPFRMYDPNADSQLWQRVTSFEKGKVYIEGTLKQLQEMTGWHGNSVLYFGDQIYSDLADLTLHHGWRTGAIIDELANEIKILNSEEFRHAVSWLQTLQHLIEEMQDHEDAEEVIDQLLLERDLLRSTTKSLFNPQFGSIFRTHHNPTYFSRRLFRYSDIYMSHVTNLLNYSMGHIFYPRRGALPHECKIPHM